MLFLRLLVDVLLFVGGVVFFSAIGHERHLVVGLLVGVNVVVRRAHEEKIASTVISCSAEGKPESAALDKGGISRRSWQG